MIDCPVELNVNGFWKCPVCRKVYKLKSKKPPKWNCTEVAPRTNEYIRETLWPICAACKEWMVDEKGLRCKLLKSCRPIRQTEQLWKHGHCPKGKW